jgi:hypothetical protein
MARMWSTRMLALLAAPLAALVLAAPASAQWDYGGPPVMDWLTPHLQAQQWCNVSWCRVDDDAASSPPTAEERARERRRMRREARAERRREQRAKARERRRMRRNARKLRFVPVPEVSERVRADLVANFAPGDTPAAIQLRAEFEANPPLRQFNELFELNTDWSARDAADVYAFSLIMLWLTIDDATRTTTAVDNAVRADIRAAMAAAPKAWKTSDANQQELAERIASWTTVLVGQHNYLAQLGDARPAGVPSAEEFLETLMDLGQSSHLFGVDLSAVKLTRKGIVPR